MTPIQIVESRVSKRQCTFLKDYLFVVQDMMGCVTCGMTMQTNNCI